MRIPVWSDSTPLDHRHDYRFTRARVDALLADHAALQLDPADITRGIQLLPADGVARRNQSSEYRGSPESHGCLTANEMALNTDYTGKTEQFHRLSREYENELAKHEAKGRRGTPRACAVIAARVKTVLSDPAKAREVRVVPRGTLKAMPELAL